MPLTKTGKRVMARMKKQYGEHAEEVFYATMRKQHMEQQWHHSPAQYDDAALGETPPRIKFQVVQENLGVELPQRAGGIPAGVQREDGTANPRADGQTKMASPTLPRGEKTPFYPAGVDRFSGENL